MDARIYGHSGPCLNLSMESQSDTVTYPPPNAGQFLSEFPLLDGDSEGQRINHWPLDIHSNIHSPQVNDELFLASLRSSIQPTLIQGMDERVRTQPPHHENLTNSVHEEDLPALRPLDHMRSSTAFSSFAEHDYASSTPPIGLVNVNTTSGWHQEDITMYIPPVQGRRYDHTNTTINFLVPSIVPSIPHMPVVDSYAEQGGSQDQYQESQRTGTRHDVVPVSSRSSRPPAGITTRRAPMRRYPCNVCGKRYLRPRGLKRHQREAHGASPCDYCRDFKWGRPYLLRNHLKKRHPHVNIDAALEEATTHRRETGVGASQAIVETKHSSSTAVLMN